MKLNVSSITDKKFIVFKLSEQSCALPVECIREVVLAPLLSRPPSLPSILEGFLTFDNSAVPVVHMNRLFNFPEQKAGLYTPLIVLKSAKYPIALLVDQVTTIIPVPQNAFLPVQEKHSFNNCVEAQITLNNSIIYVLNFDHLMLEQERRAIDEFQAVEQKRINDLNLGKK